jgi:hypothetical protein
MSDDFGRLRGALTDLAEHGGSPDLYERTIRTSQRLQRQRVFAIGGVAAAVVVAIGVGVAAAGSPQAAPPPPAAGSPSAHPSAAPSVLTHQTRPDTAVVTSPTGTSHCSVAAATLNKALPAEYKVNGFQLTQDTVRCWKNYAWATDSNWQGDGDALFRHSSTGWHFLSEGSALVCADLGVKVDPKDPPPFCG